MQPATRCTGRLDGVRALVTRPESAAGRLARALAADGAQVHRVPAIVIAPVDDTRSFERLRVRLGEVAAAVFTSVNSVEGFFRLMPDAGLRALSAGPAVLAVGGATAEALRARGVAGVVTPNGRFDSEGLLACPQLDAQRVAGRPVAVVKGEGGRDLLRKELERRGAEVLVADVYRRRAPDRLAERLDRVRGSTDVVTVTSVEALRNLAAAAPWVPPWLARCAVVTVSERVAAVARTLNLPRVSVSGGADAASIVEATARAVAGTRVTGTRVTGTRGDDTRVAGTRVAVRGAKVRTPAPACRTASAVTGVMVSTEARRTMDIVNKLGLHARAAAKLIDLASGFESRIRIRRDGREADAKSIMKVMMLAASRGTSIEVVAQGADAEEAVEAIERLVAGRFDEAE